MRAITLWRPWPWAFFHAGKRIENRSWPPPKSAIGEVVAIHAGKRFDADAAVRFEGGAFGSRARALPLAESAHPTGIVGTFRIVDACPIFDLPDEHDSPFVFGPWCWVVEDVTELAHPVPCLGAQGLWTVPVDVAAEVRKQHHAAGGAPCA